MDTFEHKPDVDIKATLSEIKAIEAELASTTKVLDRQLADLGFVVGSGSRMLETAYRMNPCFHPDNAWRVVSLRGENTARLSGTFLLVGTSWRDHAVVKSLVHGWYRERARVAFEQRLQSCIELTRRHGINEAELQIRA